VIRSTVGFTVTATVTGALAGTPATELVPTTVKVQYQRCRQCRNAGCGEGEWLVRFLFPVPVSMNVTPAGAVQV